MNREGVEERNKAYQSVMSHGQGSKGEEIVKGYVNALREYTLSLEAQLKSKDELLMEFADLLVNPYDFSDRETDEIKDKAQDYINKES